MSAKEIDLSTSSAHVDADFTTHRLSSEKLAVVDASFIIRSVDDALARGMSDENVGKLCEDFSTMISDYVKDHPSEMLEKPPEKLMEQLVLGLSTVIISKKDDEYIPLYHGTMYPTFEAGEEAWFGLQIYELGSAIAHPEYRRGYKLGSRGSQSRVELVNSFATKDVDAVGISTVKRVITGHVLGHAGAAPISYWDFPYTAFLTDTCKGTSERYGHESCMYRRLPEDSTDAELNSMFKDVGENPKIPCTLMATNGEALRQFELKCRQLHADLEDEPLVSGSISVADYKRAEWFFDQMTKLAKGE